MKNLLSNFNGRLDRYNPRRVRPYHWVALSAWISKFVSAGIQLVIIRILIERLGIEDYACIVLLIALAGWFALADFGIGSSLQNYISECFSTNKKIDSFIVTAGGISAITLSISVLFLYFISTSIGPIYLKGIENLTDSNKSNFFWWFGLISLIGVGGGLIFKVWYAINKGYLANILLLVISLISLGLVEFGPVYWSRENQMLWYITALSGPTTFLTVLFLSYNFFKSYNRGGRPSVACAHVLIKRSSGFLVFAFLSAITLQIDYIVISQYLIPEEITIYSIATKLYSTVFFVYYAILMAVWPVFSMLIIDNKWPQVFNELRKILLFGIIALISFTIFAVLFNQQIIQIIAPKSNIIISNSILVLMCIYYFLRVWTDAFTTVLSSISDTKNLIFWVATQAILNLILQLYLVPKFGLIGLMISLILCFLCTVSWAIPIRVFKHSKKLA